MAAAAVVGEGLRNFKDHLVMAVVKIGNCSGPRSRMRS